MASEQWQKGETSRKDVVNSILRCWNLAHGDEEWQRAAEDAVERIRGTGRGGTA